MLAELRIENLVLIERVHLDLAQGYNAFTGETGAGKSLLVDALGLLFGARGEPDLVRPGAESAEVSARFVLHDQELVEGLTERLGIAFEQGETPAGARKGERSFEIVVSRSLPREGRARAYANGRPVAVAALKELGQELLDIHGQHENQSLLRPGTRLEILDRFAEANSERAAMRRAHQEARAAAEDLARLRRAARERQGREDLYRFQLKELDEARLDEIEPEALESDLKLLRGAEKIREATQTASELLDGDDETSAASRIGRALKGVQHLGDAGAEAQELGARLESLLADARDLARDLGSLSEKARSDPERLADLEDARARWRTLERKHGRDLASLRALRDELRLKLGELAHLDVKTEACEAALEKAVAHLRAAAEKLTRKRKAAARDLERLAAAELGDLELAGAKLKVELAAHEAADAGAEGGDEAARMIPAQLHATGAETAELLFSANPELPLKPLAECASGGELSRVMLALKGVLAKAGGADRLPVVVFDEVDSGVGGRLGAVLGRKLAGLARIRQILCVTHMPQVAAFAQRQIRVEKARAGKAAGNAVTAAAVEGEQRIAELAMMLRGHEASDRTRAEAREMLLAAQGTPGAAKPARTRAAKR
ncbi:MAG: DNA repair protein RecN [Planctomycetota bacterium]|nr:DNA repair protein RecN [Planctomycetota bacterium]